MTEYLTFALILIGLTVILVMLWLRHRTRRAGIIAQSLITLNEQLDFDVIELLRQVQPMLLQASFTGMTWRLDWFGTELEESVGRLTGTPSEHALQAPGLSLRVTLFRPGNVRWERRYFSRHVEATLMLLLRMNMWMKAAVVSKADKEVKHRDIFLQHDMKNLAQYLHLIADQLQQVTYEPHLEKLFQSMFLVRRRADHLLSALRSNDTSTAASQCCPLDMIRELCDLHRLPAKIRGSFQLTVPMTELESILDNLLKNYADHAARTRTTPQLRILLSTNGMPKIVFYDRRPTPAPPIERLFEPFFTTHGQGSGIGLYQARSQAESIGACLQARRDKRDRLIFELSFPCAAKKHASALDDDHNLPLSKPEPNTLRLSMQN